MISIVTFVWVPSAGISSVADDSEGKTQGHERCRVRRLPPTQRHQGAIAPEPAAAARSRRSRSKSLVWRHWVISCSSLSNGLLILQALGGAPWIPTLPPTSPSTSGDSDVRLVGCRTVFG